MQTRTEIVDELREVERDLRAYQQARDALQRRINEMEGTPRHEIFLQWAVTQVVMNSLIIATVRCEGLIEDYRKVLESMSAPDNVVALVERKPE